MELINKFFLKVIPTIWFFDLEETFIESWDNPHIWNEERIKQFISI